MSKKRPQPATARQIEVYALIYIHGCKYSEAAARLKCSEQNIGLILRRLRKKRPELFPKKALRKHIQKPIRWNNQTDVIRKF